MYEPTNRFAARGGLRVLTACLLFACAPLAAAACDEAAPAASAPDDGQDGDAPGEAPDPGMEDEGTVPDAERELPTGTPADDEVRINETKRLQVLDGVGTNAYAFPYANDFDYVWTEVEDAFDELDIEYVRLASWFEFWEPSNDNDDPFTPNWDAFDPSGIIANHDVAFAKWLTERDIDVELGVWQVGDWLASGNPRRVNPDMYPELAESIVTYMTNMEDNGVPQTIAEVQNEPGITAAIQYASPEDLRDAGHALLDALDAAGFEDVLLHGPNFHAPSEAAAHWSEVWLEDERLRERTAALSYHTWWHDDFPSYDRIRRIAEAHDVPIWATELGYCALPEGCGNGHFLLPETWATAWDYAMSYYRALSWTHASRLYHWTVVGFDGAVDPATGSRFPSFYAVKHFSNFIEPGCRMLEVASGDPSVHAVAFLFPNGERTVVLLNEGAQAKAMTLGSVEGREAFAEEAVTTTEGSYEAAASVADAEGVLAVDLPGRSITSVRLAP